MRPEASARPLPAGEGLTQGVVRSGLARLGGISGRGKPAVPAPVLRYRGLVEGVAGGVVTGWAFAPASPFERVVVSLVDPQGGRVTAVADRYRADLQLAGFGDGHVGFAIALGSRPSTGAVVAGPDDEPLPNGHVGPDAAAAGSELRRRGTIVLGLDPPHLSGLRVSGWAVDFLDPARPLRLALASEGRILSETRASRYRPDRAGAFCGFVLGHTGCERQLDLIHLPGGTRLAALP